MNFITIQNLIVLQILAPILVGALSTLNKKAGLAFCLTLFTTLFLSVSSFWILINTTTTTYYHFGGWEPPIGIEFKMDKFNAVWLFIISTVALLTFLYGKKILHEEVGESKIPLFCSVFLMLLAGMYGMVLTNDFFNLYVFVEITSLTTYALISISPNRRAIRAAFDYLVIGTIAATFILIGIGYLYIASGTLNMNDFVKKFPEIKSSTALKAGHALLLVGIIIKAGLFPVHSWMIKIYKSTGSFILPFIGSLSTKLYALIALKISFLFLAPEFVFTEKFILIAAILATILCSLSALYQDDLRSVLAFSSASQIGYIFIAISIKSRLAATIFIFSHIFTALALFMICGYINFCKKTYEIKNLRGLYKEMPYVCVLFVLNAASLIGIPLTFGFTAKLQLILALLGQRMWLTILAMAFGSLIGLLYLWKVIRIFFFDAQFVLHTIPKGFQKADLISKVERPEHTSFYVRPREREEIEDGFLKGEGYNRLLQNNYISLFTISLVSFVNLALGVLFNSLVATIDKII